MQVGRIELKIDNVSEEDTVKIQEILVALIACGGLTGMRNGKTIINFDGDGTFMGIQFDYWPWKRRKAA